MNVRVLNFILVVFFSSILMGAANAQTAYINYSRSSGKPAELFNKIEDTLKKQFETKNLQWPPQQMYVRSFKYDRQLEVWVKDDLKSAFEDTKALEEDIDKRLD